jgi:hypothetical protein
MTEADLDYNPDDPEAPEVPIPPDADVEYVEDDDFEEPEPEAPEREVAL